MQLILALLLLAAPAFAAEGLTLKTKSGLTVQFSLEEEGEAARIRFVTDKTTLTTEILGEEFQEFTFQGKSTLIAAQDLDGDGIPEIFVRTTLPPHSGQFFAFRLEEGKLTAVKFGAEEFLEVSHGGDVKLLPGKVEFQEPAEGNRLVRRTVRFAGGAFTAPSR